LRQSGFGDTLAAYGDYALLVKPGVEFTFINFEARGKAHQGRRQ
jgi:hypothetical protein